MSNSAAASYYMPYYSGPVTDGRGNPTPGFTRFQLALFNRTGKEAGTDTSYNVGQITLALDTARRAQAGAQSAQKTADTAEADAQSALLAAQDVLIFTMLTSSAQWAKAAQSLDDAALMAAQSQIWPSLLLQSSPA